MGEIIWGLFIVAITAVVLLAVCWCVLVFARQRLEVAHTSIRIGSSIFRVDFPFGSLDLDAAKIVSVDEGAIRRLTRLHYGFSPPNFEVGWFTLGNGVDAFVHLRSHDKAVYIPKGYSSALLLGFDDPDDALSLIRERSTP